MVQLTSKYRIDICRSKVYSHLVSDREDVLKFYFEYHQDRYFVAFLQIYKNICNKDLFTELKPFIKSVLVSLLYLCGLISTLFSPCISSMHDNCVSMLFFLSPSHSYFLSQPCKSSLKGVQVILHRPIDVLITAEGSMYNGRWTCFYRPLQDTA